MALYNRREFCVLAGMPTKNLNVYIQRGKVKLKGELIDDTDEVNRLFLERMIAKKGTTEPLPPAGSPDKPAKKGKPEPTEEEIEEKSTLTTILKEKGQLELLQRKNLLLLQQIEIQKKRGELVPTQSVKSLIIQHSESIKTAYIEASDNLIVVLSQQLQLTSTQTAEIRTQFVVIVNKALDAAINSTQQRLGSLVKEFSVKRGVGEHG